MVAGGVLAKGGVLLAPKAVRSGNAPARRGFKGARGEPLVASAAADRLKLPGSHVESSRKALEELKMDGDVNSKCAAAWNPGG